MIEAMKSLVLKILCGATNFPPIGELPARAPRSKRSLFIPWMNAEMATDSPQLTVRLERHFPSHDAHADPDPMFRRHADYGYRLLANRRDDVGGLLRGGATLRETPITPSFND